MSMAAGEYVSVSSQADTEKSALELEKRELAADPKGEKFELTQIYVKRGLDPELAKQVADQLTAKNALEAHLRDELGISEIATARPIQAAIASACSFAAGAALPLAVVALFPMENMAVAIVASSLIFLAGLGGLSAKIGGSPPRKGVIRVTFWSALAMAVTYGIGTAFGTVGL
jgi:VIT1/CCC1 family predicted Fe2+/Mn2+ transporter